MANDPDGTEQFDRLIQLLALKRHEQPPPGFFDRFPREVHRQILAQSNARHAWASRLRQDSNWFRQLLALLDEKPHFAGIAGVLACGLVIAGVLYANYNPLPATSLALDQSFAPTVTPALASDDSLPWAATTAVSSTNPIPDRPIPAMLFNGSTLQSQPATFDLK
jgi:hypothetical protein